MPQILDYSQALASFERLECQTLVKKYNVQILQGKDLPLDCYQVYDDQTYQSQRFLVFHVPIKLALCHQEISQLFLLNDLVADHSLLLQSQKMLRVLALS